MDGGEKQSSMAQRVRAAVRQGAEAHRDRQYIQVMSLHDQSPGAERTSSVPVPVSVPVPAAASAHTVRKKFESALDPFTETANQTHFTMMYLDHVFPFLFPFCHPSILEGGRAWLLAMLGHNEALYHSAMSLSSYFFTLILAKPPGVSRDSCEQTVWDTLERHMDAAVTVMQRDMGELDRAGDNVTLSSMASVLESIIQLLIFETAMARRVDWNIHLTAASSLFTQIMQRFGTDSDGRPDMGSVMSALYRPSIFDNVVLAHPVWNSEQGAFRFFASVLLQAEILSSVSLEKPPRLQQYHEHLLATGPVDNRDERLQMEKLMGCQGWVLVLIGEVAALAAWKREAGTVGAGVLQGELEARGEGIARRLAAGMEEIEWASQVSLELDPVASLRSYYGAESSTALADQQITVTRIWAHAARIYLCITTSGWQPENPVIRESVTSALRLFGGLSSPAHVRTLAWPLCVAGCMATVDQEQDFRDVVWTMGPLQAFGTVGEALRVMELVWGMEDHGGRETWGLADCLGILGSKVLLM